MIKRLALAGLASGILSPTILYIAGIWLDVFALFYLYVGPGLVYAICTLLAIGKTSSVWRRLAYLITVTGVYVVAVLLYLQLTEGVTSDRIAVGVVGCLGGGLVVLLTRIITPVKSLFVHGITGVFIGGMGGVGDQEGHRRQDQRRRKGAQGASCHCCSGQAGLGPLALSRQRRPAGQGMGVR